MSLVMYKRSFTREEMSFGVKLLGRSSFVLGVVFLKNEPNRPDEKISYNFPLLLQLIYTPREPRRYCSNCVGWYCVDLNMTTKVDLWAISFTAGGLVRIIE